MVSALPRQAPIRPCRCGCGSKARGWEWRERRSAGDCYIEQIVFFITPPLLRFLLVRHCCWTGIPETLLPQVERPYEKIISISSERDFIGYFLYFARCPYKVASYHISRSLLKLA